MKTLISLTTAAFILAFSSQALAVATAAPAGEPTAEAQVKQKKPKKPKKPKQDKDEGWEKCPSPPYKAGCAVKPPTTCAEGCAAPTTSGPTTDTKSGMETK